ncbi:MAG TPA: polymer-forming cytoskeletal protein [Polyangiaceae bacterium]|nr:polymer-forming cytoskeletal protein [Polyangiaceae bacterium]
MATVIGEGLSIEGDLTSNEDVAVHGTFRGKLTTDDTVVVGATGAVQADISGSSVSIAGQVTGDVTASERVDLQAGGRLVGDVRAGRFTIADGASFKGNVDMEM